MLTTESACTANSDCDKGWACVMGSCARICISNADCGAREICNADEVCEFRVPGSCARDADCTEPATCEQANGGRCVIGYCDYLDIICSSPPAESCVDNDATHRAQATRGICRAVDGVCHYETRDTPCPGCATSCLGLCDAVTCDDFQGGCRLFAFCVPNGGAGVCDYTVAPDGILCSPGVCAGGICRGCTSDADCDDGDPCTSDICLADSSCRITSIVGSCDDADPCTYGDTCGAAGLCTGTPVVCSDDADPCGLRRACNGTAVCSATWAAVTTGCDDTDPCTYDDRCDGVGGCGGTARTCDDDPEVCGVRRSCNGGPTCDVTFADGTTSCDDLNDCTSGDLCDGAGACIGTPIAAGIACGANPADRCCAGVCRDLSSDAGHCGGCGLACTSNESCESIAVTTTCSATPVRTSGRCTCIANSDCPNASPGVVDGQVCRTSTPFDNRCAPITNAGCAPGQTDVDLVGCPDYCVY